MYAEGEGRGVKLTDRTERSGLIGDSFCVFLQETGFARNDECVDEAHY